jgi:hypothetical protein
MTWTKTLKGIAAGALMTAGLAAASARANDTVPLYSPATSGVGDNGAFLLTPSTRPDETPAYLVDTIGNPAEQQPAPGYPQSQPNDEGGIVHPWEMPPINVVGNSTQLREEQKIGTYGQPVWTADRRFSEVRVYVQPEGSIDAEFWVIPQINRHGASELVTQYEVEVGFPGRIQMDLYLVPRFEGSGGKTFVDESIEFRYAFANWGEIWGNPTYYIELIHQDQGPDQIEQKMLFGGIIAPRWHWGWDLTFQHSFGADYEDTYETTVGVSYTLLDNKFDVGGEFKLQENTFHGDRRHFQDNTFVGPSFQYRPLPRMHVDFTPLIGVTHESPAAEVYMLVGFEF